METVIRILNFSEAISAIVYKSVLSELHDVLNKVKGKGPHTNQVANKAGAYLWFL